MGSQASTFSAINRSPIVDTNRVATYTFLKLLQDWNARINNLGSGGQYNGQLESTATISGRAGNIGSALQNLDQNGIVTPNGIDFARNYVNKTFAHINGVVDSTQLPGATTSVQGAVVLPAGASSNVLGTAAIRAATSFDAAGSAATAQTNAETYTDGKFTGAISATLALAKLTTGGTNGSVTINANGLVTAYTPPT